MESLRNELLNSKTFDMLQEVKAVIQRWRMKYNAIRPHSLLDRTPRPPK